MKLWYTTEGREPKKTTRKEAKRKPWSVSNVQDVNNHQEPRFDQGPWRQSAPSALILELHSMWKQMVSCNPSFSYDRSESNKVWVHPRAVAAFICELCLSETRVAPLAQRTALGIRSILHRTRHPRLRTSVRVVCCGAWCWAGLHNPRQRGNYGENCGSLLNFVFVGVLYVRAWA